MAATTVDQQIRHARKFFNHALSDDLITFNPFDRLGQNDPVEKDWHYVDREEFRNLMDAAKPGWQLLFVLCRWLGFAWRKPSDCPARRSTSKRGGSRSSAVGFHRQGQGRPDDPIIPELHEFLKITECLIGLGDPQGRDLTEERVAGFQGAVQAGEGHALPKPSHALRKSCLTDWAARFPAHVV